jgi:hypothetical protein
MSDRISWHQFSEDEATLHEVEGERVTYVKGAIEKILAGATLPITPLLLAQPFQQGRVKHLRRKRLAHEIAHTGL